MTHAAVAALSAASDEGAASQRIVTQFRSALAADVPGLVLLRLLLTVADLPSVCQVCTQYYTAPSTNLRWFQYSSLVESCLRLKRCLYFRWPCPTTWEVALLDTWTPSVQQKSPPFRRKLLHQTARASQMTRHTPLSGHPKAKRRSKCQAVGSTSQSSCQVRLWES